MFKHCGNYAAVLTNYASFFHQNTSVIRQRTYMNNWLLISASISALSTFKKLADPALNWYRCFQGLQTT